MRNARMPSDHQVAMVRSSPVRLRPIALPVEHGGWGLLAAPVVLGVWLAPSLAGIGLSVAALGVFLARQPLKLAFGDYQRGKRYPRTVWAERFALGYGAIALIGLICAITSAAAPFWLPIVLATPLRWASYSSICARRAALWPPSCAVQSRSAR